SGALLNTPPSGGIYASHRQAYLIIDVTAGCWPTTRLIARQHGSQKPEFRFYFCGIGHGIRDFLSKEFAIPLAKPVNRDFERPLGGVHFVRQRGIRRVGLTEKEHLQPLEVLRAAVLHELVPQSLNDPVEHRKRPAPLEHSLGRL